MLTFSTDDQQQGKKKKTQKKLKGKDQQKKQTMTRSKRQKKQTSPSNNSTANKEYEDKMKAMESQLSQLQELIQEQKETISKKNEELLSFQRRQRQQQQQQQQQQQRQEELPITTIDTNKNNSIDTKISGLPSNETDEFEKAQNPSVYIFCQHIDQLDSSIKQFVERQIFSKVKFTLTQEQLKTLLVNGVKQQSIIIPTNTTVEHFSEFFWTYIPKHINNIRHKCQVLMRRHFLGKSFSFLFCCIFYFFVSNTFFFFFPR